MLKQQFCLFIFIFLVNVMVYGFPKPSTYNYASVARWLTHESEYGVISVYRSDWDLVFGDIASISDGLGYDDSTGIPNMYLSSFDTIVKSVKTSPFVSITFTEKALLHPSLNCTNAEWPECARLTLTGKMYETNGTAKEECVKYMYSRHPQMIMWPHDHDWTCWRLNISHVSVLDIFGGVPNVTVEEYLTAPWY